MIKLLKKKRAKGLENMPKISTGFGKNCVFPDYWFPFDLTLISVKKFLERHNSFLVDYKISDTYIYDWIEGVCQKFNVNTRLILTLLEKYHGLISMKEIPPKELLDRALEMGYSEKLGTIPSFAGLDKQIFHCAAHHRKWFDLAGAKINTRINCIDDGDVKPKNAFTYALYMCDPYIGMEDLYRKDVVKDQNNEAIEDRIEKRGNWFQKLVGKEKTVKVIKQDTRLVKKAPFGVYQTWLIWHKFFG